MENTMTLGRPPASEFPIKIIMTPRGQCPLVPKKAWLTTSLGTEVVCPIRTVSALPMVQFRLRLVKLGNNINTVCILFMIRIALLQIPVVPIAYEMMKVVNSNPIHVLFLIHSEINPNLQRPSLSNHQKCHIDVQDLLFLHDMFPNSGSRLVTNCKIFI